MKINLEFAELHAPLFLAGTNLQMKLDPTKRTGLSMVYDRAEKELLVTYNKKTAILPSTSVLSMVERGAPVLAVASPSINKPFEAQVSTPQSHVFAGPGGGTTGQEEKRGPGRPKK